jgi:putative ABC transport system permease protein
MSLWSLFPALTPAILALRNMRVRWMRTLLTCLGIVLGVAVILAIAITNDSALNSIRDVFDEASGQASLLVRSSEAAGGFDEAGLARLRSVDGVVVAAPSVTAQTLLAQDAQTWQIAFSINGVAAGSTLLIVGVEARIDPQVRQYEFSAGRWLKGEAYEAVLAQNYAEEKDLQLGDDLLVLTPEGGVERFRVVGLLKYTGAALANDGAVAYLPLTVAQDVFQRGGELDAVDIVTTPEIANQPEALRALKDRLAQRLGKDYEVAYPAARGQLVTDMLSTYQQGLSFFSVIAIFVGAFLIYNAFSMTVLERTREIGMLRAIGTTRAQIIGLVLTEALLLALIGSLIGIGGGLLLARGLIWMLGGVVSTEINTLTVPLDGLAQSLSVGLLVTLVSALLPAAQAARISPLSALRGQGQAAARPKLAPALLGTGVMVIAWCVLYYIPIDPQYSFYTGQAAIMFLMFGATQIVPAVVGLAERLARRAARLAFGNEGLLGASNVRRAVNRTALTVASLMIGLAMVIAVNSLSTAFTSDITSWVDNALGGDLFVRAPIPMREQFARQLASVPGVQSVTPVRYFNVKIAPASIPAEVQDQDTVIFAGIDPATYRLAGEMEFASGQGDPEALWARFRQGGALFISTTVADRYGVTQGQTMRLITSRGERDFDVAGVAVDFTGQGNIVTGSWNDMKRLFGKAGVDRFTIKLAPGYATDRVRGEIEARYKAKQNISVETTQDFKAQITELSQRSFRLFDVLGLIGIVVAALGVINTMMMNVLERQREIGSLRSLGLTRWQTTKMVLAEAATLGAIGGAFGLLFGYVLSKIFVDALNSMTGYALEYVFVASIFGVGAVIALAVSQVAALYPAWKAAGVNIVEAIKHE